MSALNRPPFTSVHGLIVERDTLDKALNELAQTVAMKTAGLSDGFSACQLVAAAALAAAGWLPEATGHDRGD